MNKSFKALYGMRYLLLLLVPLLVVMVAISTMGMKVPSKRDKTPEMSILAEPTVPLGTTAPFAVLAHTGITVNGVATTTINGDAGNDSAIPSVATGALIVNGAGHYNDGVALQAHTDLTTAFNNASSRTPTNLGGTQLGGRTLTPGVYSTGGVLEITGGTLTLTLDAQGDPPMLSLYFSLRQVQVLL